MQYLPYIIAWLGFGILAHGLYFAYVQREYPEMAKECYKDDLAVSALMIPLGLSGFIAALITTKFGSKGFKLY